jgi:mannose-6-phosphate isomerase-like protein (cupin superfamily)
VPVIRLSDVPETPVDRGDMKLVMKKAIGSRDRDPNFTMPTSTDSLSVTYIKHWSRHQRMRCAESDRVMFVVEGQTVVQIGDEPPERLHAGDLAFIPKGTPYEFRGDFIYLVINSPAFKEGTDIVEPS